MIKVGSCIPCDHVTGRSRIQRMPSKNIHARSQHFGSASSGYTYFEDNAKPHANCRMGVEEDACGEAAATVVVLVAHSTVAFSAPATSGTGATTRARETDRGRGDRGVRADETAAAVAFGDATRARERRARGEAAMPVFQLRELRSVVLAAREEHGRRGVRLNF